MTLSQKVFFRLNDPLAVALASADGVLKQGRYGPYWTYLLEDDRVMFVPPVVQEQIQQLGITQGQKFTITKTQERGGDFRGPRWIVTPPGEKVQKPDAVLTTEEEEPVLQQAEEGSRVEGQVATKVAMEGESPEVPPSSETNVAPAEWNGEGSKPPADAPNSNSAVNGSGKPNGKGPAVELNCSPLLKAALRAAVDAVIDAEQYAASRSYNVRFTSEDVRAAGISIFIAARDGGRR